MLENVDQRLVHPDMMHRMGRACHTSAVGADKHVAMSARDRVLRVAMELIVERGLDQVRLAEIGSRAKMSTGHVLYYFGTKDRILVETLVWAEAELARRRHEAIARAEPGWDQLTVFVNHYLPKSAADPLWALWVEMWARRHGDGRRPAVEQTAAVWLDDLRAILRDGRQAGVFMREPPSFSERLIALMDGLAVQILQKTRSRPQAIGLVMEQCRRELGGREPLAKRPRSS